MQVSLNSVRLQETKHFKLAQQLCPVSVEKLIEVNESYRQWTRPNRELLCGD